MADSGVLGIRGQRRRSADKVFLPQLQQVPPALLRVRRTRRSLVGMPIDSLEWSINWAYRPGGPGIASWTREGVGTTAEGGGGGCVGVVVVPTEAVKSLITNPVTIFGSDMLMATIEVQSERAKPL